MTTGYNFTERVRKVLALSREEAGRLHEYVGTEHLLLGLITDGEGVAAAVMQALGVDLAKVRTDIETQVKTGHAGDAVGPDLPYTSRAKKVLEWSMAEARDLNHHYVGTEHLLLGLLAEEKGIAAQVLVSHGLTLERARAETLRLLGSPDELSAPAARARFEEFSTRPDNRHSLKVAGVFVEMHFDDGTTQRKEFANAAWAIKYLENM